MTHDILSPEALHVLEAAYALAPEERAAVAEHLRASLVPIDPEILRKIVAEAQDRLRAYEAGEMTAISLEECFEEVRSRDPARVQALRIQQARDRLAAYEAGKSETLSLDELFEEAGDP